MRVAPIVFATLITAGCTRAPASPPVASREKNATAASRSPLRAQCGKPGDLVDLETVEGYRVQLRHRWIHCKGSYIFNVKHDGIELTADGKWHLLDIGSDGITLTRRKGFDGSGDWKFLEDGSMPPQLNLYKGGGDNGGRVAFQQNPIAMQFHYFMGFSEYVAAD